MFKIPEWAEVCHRCTRGDSDVPQVITRLLRYARGESNEVCPRYTLGG
jgi:hypothetical protein